MKRALRKAYGEKLVELGAKDPSFLVFDADLSGSTQTALFGKSFPNRHFNMGIAENNMVLVAAGASRVLPLIFASTFSMFLAGRSWEMIRNSIAHDSLNVKLVATHAGISVGEDGSSHQMVEDLAIMRAIPNLTVICPGDYVETQAVIQYAAETPGPMYIRLSRGESEDLFSPGSYTFCNSRGIFLSDPTKKGMALLATTGLTTAFGKQVVEELAGKGIFLDHIHFPVLKPIDLSLIQERFNNYRFIVSYEEHSIVGGLGDTLLGVLSSEPHPPLYKLGIPDTFGRSGKAEELWKYFELDAPSVARKISQLV